jgi:signal transduction histidine kinase
MLTGNTSTPLPLDDGALAETGRVHCDPGMSPGMSADISASMSAGISPGVSTSVSPGAGTNAGASAHSDVSIPEGRTDQAPSIDSQPAGCLRVLIVEDDPSDVELALYGLKKGGFTPDADVVQTSDDFKARIFKNAYEVVLADYGLPGWNGMETVEILRKAGLDTPVIMVSGALGELKAVECIKQGAADYVLKDHWARLPDSVRRAIREKKLRDDHRKAQSDLARSNRELEQFAYVASHDLQEPLRMVAAYTQLLAERYHGKLDANADKYIHYIVDGALRMQMLIQDLLTFSRVGRGGIERQPVQVGDVLKIAIRNLGAAIEESSAHITVDPLPNVIADRPMLVQLFQNLIANAIKFRGPSPPAIRVAAEKKANEWVLSVADNGIGIAPEYFEIIFVVFKRLHTHDEYPGSGIGLSICKKIVEQHGGCIWVESQPGQGATFKFTLPEPTTREELRSPR